MAEIAMQDRQQIDAILGGYHPDPFSFLGPHDGGGGVTLRAFLPDALRVRVVDPGSRAVLAELARVHEAGFFVATLPQRTPYRYLVDWDQEVEIDDPYRFPPWLGDLDVYLLAEGAHREAYRKLGAHPTVMEDTPGVAFAVWAPNASRVSVVGDFNNWDGRRHLMRLRHSCGVWEIFIPGLKPGDRYKYEIRARDGTLLPLKADPYAFSAERPPSTASVIADESTYAWSDTNWMATRSGANDRSAPIAIYEVHLGSWRRRAVEGNRYLTYRELADELVPYAKEMGFTHLELLPVSEYPFDGSWGYQPIGLFAPTSRFGSPDEFRGFVDACHQAGLGVILDWVPGHFPEDVQGLGFFDGTHLYEHADPRQGRQKDWGTLVYNYGRNEVSNFLLSNALFWFDCFHIDGLRVDAVASMLYLDYSRAPGEWVPNIYGGNENLEAIAFIRRMNEVVYGRFPGVLTVAEESTAWPMVSRPTYLGGLGFAYKWNMGWMHDTLDYIGHESIHRSYHHNELTFGLLYAFTENFILPLSHDEVVHGKRSLLSKMPGDRWQQFANLRAYLAFQYTQPGKKLLFMGGEIAQRREWSHDDQLEWHLLDDPMHLGIQRLVRDMNSLYRTLPALHARDCEADGFEWIDCNDAASSVIAYLRRGSGGEWAVGVINFTPIVRQGYRIGVPAPGTYDEVLNTDSGLYGGSNVGNGGSVSAEQVSAHGRPFSLILTLPPLACVVFRPRGG